MPRQRTAALLSFPIATALLITCFVLVLSSVFAQNQSLALSADERRRNLFQITPSTAITSMTLTRPILKPNSANTIPSAKIMDDPSSSSSSSSTTSSNSSTNDNSTARGPAAAAAPQDMLQSPNALLDGGRRGSPTVPAQKLKNLLAALNFVEPSSAISISSSSGVVNENRRSGKSKSSSTRSSKRAGSLNKSMDSKTTTKQGIDVIQESLEAKSTPLTTKQAEQQQQQQQQNEQQQQRRIRHRVLHGTVDLEEDVEIVVYFDARQEESDSSSTSSSLDEHHQTKNSAYPRGESIVLDNILLTRGGGGSGGTSGADSSPYTDHELDQLGLLDDDGESSSFAQASATTSDVIMQQPTSSPTDSPTSAAAASAFSAHTKKKNIPHPPPPPPQELPLRFLRAGKGDPVEGIRRYKASLSWRKEHQIDTILRQPEFTFDLIQQHYPAFIHGRGRNGEPCYYEQPPKTNLKALRSGGVTLDDLLHHYALMTEYMWQHVERDDLARSIYIIDLQGIRLGDFVGEVVDFVKKASEVSSQHYPERAGYVFVIHVPAWFKLIWSVVKPWVDPVTLDKIKILRGDEEVKRVLQERIPYNQLPKNYGGAETSPALGESPEMLYLSKWIAHNNEMAKNNGECPNNGSHCPFCSWTPARSY